MFVNTNVAALNAWQNLLNTQNSMTATLQQLSSGYKINSAADNPAGLAIAQQMQSQIDGMNQAYQNAQTGISMLQTTDGALAQIQSILQSMYSLATQAANSTNVGVDRGSIQSQMDQYTKEIDSITNQTAFNNKNLLDGVLGTVNLAIGADPNQELAFTLAAVDAKSLNVAGSQPISAAFSSSAATTASSLGIAGPTLFGANSVTNPYGSYALTGGTYNVVMANAALATFTVTGTNSATVTASTTTTINNEVYYGNANTTAIDGVQVFTTSVSGQSATTGSITPEALSSTGANTQTIYLELQTTSSFSNSTSPSGTTYTVLWSTNGTSWTTLTTTSTLSGTLTLGDTGAAVNLADITAPSLSLTTAGTATVTAQDNWTINLTPQSATLELQDANSNIIGSPVTVTGTSNSQIVLGNPSDGEAIGLSMNLTNLITAGTSPATMQFNIQYAQNSSAQGSGGEVLSKAVVTSGLSVMNYAQATQAQQAIQAALTQVSAERAQVGSLIDRLNQASQDLTTSQLNLTSARGVIMDADVALEMAKLSKEQVLQQSGVGMLAQANALPQALLKLIP